MNLVLTSKSEEKNKPLEVAQRLGEMTNAPVALEKNINIVAAQYS